MAAGLLSRLVPSLAGVYKSAAENRQYKISTVHIAIALVGCSCASHS